MKNKFRLTKDGVAELKQELIELTERRKSVVERLKSARELGDLSENAEYHSAQDELSQVDGRIGEIEHILKHVEIINRPRSKSTVELGNTVSLKNGEGDKTVTVVGSVEADPAENKISDESPLGQAIIGKKVGDKVEITTPGGTTLYTIKKIS